MAFCGVYVRNLRMDALISLYGFRDWYLGRYLRIIKLSADTRRARRTGMIFHGPMGNRLERLLGRLVYTTPWIEGLELRETSPDE